MLIGIAEDNIKFQEKVKKIAEKRKEGMNKTPKKVTAEDLGIPPELLDEEPSELKTSKFKRSEYKIRPKTKEEINEEKKSLKEKSFNWRRKKSEK